LGNYAEAKHLLQQGLALAKETGDPKLTALILNYIGLVADRLGDYAAAKQWLQESIIISRAIDDRWSMIVCLNHLGAIAYQRGSAEWPEAKRLHEESLFIAKELGERREIAASLNYLGYVTCALAEYGSARTHFLTALETAIEGQMTPVALDALVGLATLLTCQPGADAEPASTITNQQASQLLAFVLSHPASSQEVKDRAQRLQAELDAISSRQIAVAIQAPGQARNLQEALIQLRAVDDRLQQAAMAC
jgi:tetratricopeptide (TPR) repeat protein